MSAVDESSVSNEQTQPLVEGLDFYFEEGLMVLTENYLIRRGYCCGNKCRHCPYEYENVPDHNK